MAKHGEGSRTIAGGDHLRTQHPINFAIPYPTRPFTGDAGESGVRREEGEPHRKSSRKDQREGKTAR